MMRVLAAVIVGLLLLCPPPASAQPRSSADAQLLRARDRFDYGDYADAVRILRRLIDEGRLVSEQQLVEAHRLLGVSLFYAGDEENSRAAFVRLLSIEPDFRLDPFFHPPKLVEFFDAVRADNEALLAPLRDQRRRLEEQRRLEEDARRRLLDEEERRRLVRQGLQQPEGETDLVVERVISNHTYVVNWLPFGAGQFQNDDNAKAVGLATAQVITGTASVLGYAVVAAAPRCREVVVPPGSAGEAPQTRVECRIPPESLNLVRNMDRMKWISGAMFWGLVAYGIVDAHLNYQPLEVVSERRLRLPSIIESPVDTTAGEDSIEEGGETGAGIEPSAELRRYQSFQPAAGYAAGNRGPGLELRLSPWLAPDGLGAGLTLRF